MAIVINGSGTVTGISVGGLPDDIVDAGTLADNAVGLAQMAGGTDGNIITYDTSGNPAVVATGTSGHFLKSAGADAVPTFAAVGGIDCDADAWHFRLSSSTDKGVSASVWDFDEEIHKGSNITESGGVITVGTAGWYLINLTATNYSGSQTATNANIRKEDTKVGGRIYWDGAVDDRYDVGSIQIICEASATDTFDIYGYGYWYGESGVGAMCQWSGIRLGA